MQQAKAEQEEEFISNTLLKKIQALKKEKESLALNYEQEEECLTNDLSRKLNQVKKNNRKTGRDVLSFFFSSFVKRRFSWSTPLSRSRNVSSTNS